MGSKHEILTLGQAISEFLDKFKLSDKVMESKVVTSWPAVMGNNVAKLTHSLYFKGKGVLIVKLNSSVLRSELLMHRSKIVKNLNDYLGYEAVKEVILK
jgi:hypothetical protein